VSRNEALKMNLGNVRVSMIPVFFRTAGAAAQKLREFISLFQGRADYTSC
jgi:hypothetical protein